MAGLASITEFATGEYLPLVFPPVVRRAPVPAGVGYKDIDLLLSRVMERAPQCPEPTALRYLRDAAIEFCRRTRIWRESQAVDLLDPFEILTSGVPASQIYEISAAYYFEPGENPETCKGRQLEPATMDWLDNERPGWRVEAAPPDFVTQVTPNSVMVTPWCAGKVRLELILLPDESANEFPDFLIDAYQREIADGALGAVMALPRVWRDDKLAAFHGAGFQASLDRFGARVPKGQQRARPRTTRGSFF